MSGTVLHIQWKEDFEERERERELSSISTFTLKLLNDVNLKWLRGFCSEVVVF